MVSAVVKKKACTTASGYANSWSKEVGERGRGRGNGNGGGSGSVDQCRLDGTRSCRITGQQVNDRRKIRRAAEYGE